MALHNKRQQHQKWFRVIFKAVPQIPGIPGPNGRGPFGPFPKKDDAYMTDVALNRYKILPEAITIDHWEPCTQDEINLLEGRGIPGNLNIPDDIEYDDNSTFKELKMKLAEREARLTRSIQAKLNSEAKEEVSEAIEPVKRAREKK